MYYDPRPPLPPGPSHDSSPELVRVNYFHGQMLGARDFRAEQAYHRAKHQLVNRCLLGYGVVCGLEVETEPLPPDCRDPQEEACLTLETELAAAERSVEAALDNVRQVGGDAKQQRAASEALTEAEARAEELRRRYEAECGKASRPSRRAPLPLLLRIGAGLAINPQGDELVVRHGIRIDLRDHLSPEERERIARRGHATVWLSLCYQECSFERVAVAAMDACQITPGCMDARVREGVRVKASLEEPDSDKRCNSCCEGACETCVLLAAIQVTDGRPLLPNDVDLSVRRPFGLYAPTMITGINWRHGGTYSGEAARDLLGRRNSGGLEIHFSRPVHAETVTPGIMDVWILRGGRGYAGAVQLVQGGFLPLDATGLVDRILWRARTDETPQPEDRILIILRCDFILDACCRPVDGNHVGGRVPDISNGGGRTRRIAGLLEDARRNPPYASGDRPRRDGTYPASPQPETQDGQTRQEPVSNGAPEPPCARMPGNRGPWTSGNGQPGGSFESWIFISPANEEAAQ
ncbi:MAG: hypothetical protein AB7O44_26450 [Hyphomicrobiaceae bacterium]